MSVASTLQPYGYELTGMIATINYYPQSPFPFHGEWIRRKHLKINNYFLGFLNVQQ